MDETTANPYYSQESHSWENPMNSKTAMYEIKALWEK
jgi:hypothetical protein